MAGYSGTALAKKLGVAEGATVHLIGAPAHYRQLVDPLPPGVRIVKKFTATVDVVHIFALQRARLAESLKTLHTTMKQNGTVWVSWPKKSAKVETDITEDVIRAVALPMGLVDVKVCAVDDTWSGLKLVIRKELRKQQTGRSR